MAEQAMVKKVITWLSALGGVMVVGLIGLGFYAIFDKPLDGQHAQSGWVIFGCGLLLALASALVGALAGLIFGIPKTTRVTPTTSRATGATATVVSYEGNTNLEEISDWLTKILVGAGLVQIGKLPGMFNALGSRLQDSGCLGSCGYVAGPAIVIAYSIAGFGIAYLWARIYLERELEMSP